MVRNPTLTGVVGAAARAPFDRVKARLPRAVTLFCGEALRATACVVVDALLVRGFKVALNTGRDARTALRRSIRDALPTLRVLCVPHPLDARGHARLQRAFDPEARGDLLIVTLETPAQVVQAIERATGSAPARSHQRRTRRTILAHPTLVERKLDMRRFVSAGLGALAASLMLAAASPWLVPAMRSREVIRIGTPAREASMHQAASLGARDLDDPVLSHAAVEPMGEQWRSDPAFEPDDIVVTVPDEKAKETAEKVAKKPTAKRAAPSRLAGPRAPIEPRPYQVRPAAPDEIEPPPYRPSGVAKPIGRRAVSRRAIVMEKVEPLLPEPLDPFAKP